MRTNFLVESDQEQNPAPECCVLYSLFSCVFQGENAGGAHTTFLQPHNTLSTNSKKCSIRKFYRPKALQKPQKLVTFLMTDFSCHSEHFHSGA